MTSPQRSTTENPSPPHAPRAMLQRKCACGSHTQGGGRCEACQRGAILHRKAGHAAAVAGIPPLVHEVTASPGRPLDAGTRAFMEPRFGKDFSGVRVHTDTRAARSAKDVNALAYALGRDLVFAEGRYAPATTEGRLLLAHELAHVVQGGGTPQAEGISEPSDPSERQADRLAERVVAGDPVVGSGPASEGGILYRQAAPTATPSSGGAGGTPSSTVPPLPAHPPPLTNLSHGYQLFDATLDRSTSLLTIQKKIKFEFPDHPPANLAPYAVPWPPGRAERWTQDFIRTVTQRWSFKFPLTPETSPCPGETCQSIRAQVQVIPVTSGEHTLMEVANYDNTGWPSPQAHTGTGTAHLFSPNTEPSRGDGGNTQVAAEHEFGHMLGLPHINAANCGANPNAARCYGENASQMANIMGRGSEISPADYAPFVETMERFSPCHWRVQPGGINGWALAGWMGGLAGAGALIGGLAGGPLGAAIGAGIGAVAGLVIGLATS